MHDIESMLPDVHEHPEYYRFGSEGEDEALHHIHRVRGNPDAKVQIYRALPAEYAHRGFQPGDWVTPSKAYARQHARQEHPHDDLPVIRTTVRAGELWNEGYSTEFGYSGPARQGMVSHKGGRNQEVRQHADGVIRAVQRRPKQAALTPGEYEFRFRPAQPRSMDAQADNSLHFHRLDAFHTPTQQATNGRAGHAGLLLWHHKSGQIGTTEVFEPHQRQGLATEMLNQARQIAADTRGVRPPRHSPERTDAGEAWARSLNERLPRRSAAWADPGHKPEYESLREGASDDEASAHFDRQRAIRNDWERGVRHGLAMGHLSNEQAHERGYRGSGHDRDSYGQLTWAPLPHTLYHVTTNVPSVHRSGLKSRDELSQAFGKGLGGGESDTISYTDDPKIARDIHHSLGEFHDVVTGKVTPHQLMARARTGDMGSKPFERQMRESNIMNIDRVLRGRQSMGDAFSTQAEMDAKHGPGRAAPAPDSVAIQAPKGTVHTRWERESTPEEHREDAASLYKTFSAMREHAGGHPDPLFFSTDVAGLAATRRADHGIVKVHPKPGAHGYQLHALGEWRSPTGDNVEVDRSHDPHTAATDKWPPYLTERPNEDGYPTPVNVSRSNPRGPVTTEEQAQAAGLAGPYYHGTSKRRAREIRRGGFRQPRLHNWEMEDVGTSEEIDLGHTHRTFFAQKHEDALHFARAHHGDEADVVKAYLHPDHVETDSGGGWMPSVQCRDATKITAIRPTPKTASSLSDEALISVAEHAMEDSGLAGRQWHVPKMHADDPQRHEVYRPVHEFVRGVLAAHGYEHAQHIRVEPAHWDLREPGSGQAMVNAMGTIGLKGEHTNDMTLLHECAHLLTRTGEGPGGHGPPFQQAVHRLYHDHLGPKAAETFDGVVHALPRLTPPHTAAARWGGALQWVHVTPAENKASILAHGIRQDPGVDHYNQSERKGNRGIYLTSPEHASDWAKEIARMRGESTGEYSVFKVHTEHLPSWSFNGMGVATQRNGDMMQGVVRSGDIAPEHVEHVGDITVDRRRPTAPRTAAAGDYIYRHAQPDNKEHHWVTAHHPVTGERLGDMTWHAHGDHHVSWIAVYDQEHRRQGIGTGMWNKAREVDPLVTHNPDTEQGQTDAGRAWARTTAALVQHLRKRAVQDCPECHGVGSQHFSNDQGQEWDRSCYTCGGTGRTHEQGDWPRPDYPPEQERVNSADVNTRRHRALDLAKHPVPGTVVWRGEVRHNSERGQAPSSVGMHWTVKPEMVVMGGHDLPEDHHRVMWQGVVDDPDQQTIPRSHPIWRGRHQSLDSEAEVRLRPGTQVRLTGAYTSTEPHSAPSPDRPQRTPASWSFHPFAGHHATVEHRRSSDDGLMAYHEPFPDLFAHQSATDAVSFETTGRGLTWPRMARPGTARLGAVRLGGAGEAGKEARSRPHERVFGRTWGLDRRLWEPSGTLKADVRAYLLRKVGSWLSSHYGPGWEHWARIYFAGSEASLWTGPDRIGNSDFDVLLGINYAAMRKAVPALAHASNARITDLLNDQLRAELRDPAELIPVEGQLTGPWDATFYVNKDSWDIRDIRPYAAFDVVANRWAVKPPDLPDWSLDKLPKAVVKALSAAESYARDVLALPEPQRTQQGAALFESWHSDRSRAFSPHGEGWWDFANLREKWLDQVGVWKELVDAKHRDEQGLGMSPEDWSNTPPYYDVPDTPVTTAKKYKTHAEFRAAQRRGLAKEGTAIAPERTGEEEDEEPHEYPPIYREHLSTPDGRRSRPVTHEQFQEHARRGQEKFEQLRREGGEPTGLDAHWPELVHHAYGEAQKEWGGVTINTHTGHLVHPDADSYALTTRHPNAPEISIPHHASEAEFGAAMDHARQVHADMLRHKGAHLGVFRDEDKRSIDIDPVTVVHRLEDVEDVGAFTRGVGGAYHFRSGDGYWPPHVSEEARAARHPHPRPVESRRHDLAWQGAAGTAWHGGARPGSARFGGAGEARTGTAAVTAQWPPHTAGLGDPPTLADALRAWVGHSGDVRGHLAEHATGTAPEPRSGNERVDQERARLLHTALQASAPIPRRLYRGASESGLHPHVPTSWTEARKVAEGWARRSGGAVHVLEPGQARGLRMADHIPSQANDIERQWLVVAHPVSRQASYGDYLSGGGLDQARERLYSQPQHHRGDPWATNQYPGSVAWVRTDKMLPLRHHDGTDNGRSPEVTRALTEGFRRGEGWLSPLQLNYSAEDHATWLGEGNHRLAAAHLAGQSHVPVTIAHVRGGDLPAYYRPAPFPQKVHSYAELKALRGRSGDTIHPRHVLPADWLLADQPDASQHTAGFQHRPAGPPRPEDNYQGGQPAHDLDFGRSGSSRYDASPTRRVRTLFDHPDTKVIRALMNARGEPEHPLTMYRALPHEHIESGFRPGDWVTLSKAYAQSHARGNGYAVIKASVPARYLWTEGDYNEWGYHGEPVQGEVHTLGRQAQHTAVGPTRLERAWGSHSPQALFGDGPSTSVPWPRAGRRKDRKDYDAARVHEVITNPEHHHMQDVDPRELHATQPGLSHAGVRHYLGDSYEHTGQTYADHHVLSNRRPVVYQREDGQNLLLSGHHRAAAALLQGRPLQALVVSGPWGQAR